MDYIQYDQGKDWNRKFVLRQSCHPITQLAIHESYSQPE